MDALGDLEAAELRAAVFLEFLLSDFRAGTDNDSRMDILALD